MAEQLKLFENLPVLNQGINKPKEQTQEEQSQKQLEKYATQHNYGGKLWDGFVGNKTVENESPKETWNRLDSNERKRQEVVKKELAEKAKEKKHLKDLILFGLENSSEPVVKNPVMRKALEPKPKSVNYLSNNYSFAENFKKQSKNIKDYKPKQKQPFHIYNPVTRELDNVNDPNYLKPKPRVETTVERIDRLQYELGGIDKEPAHYNNPNIIDYENFKQPPREFKGDDKSTYPSDRSQKQRLNTWDLMVETANTPQEKKEVREILNGDYKKNKGKFMSTKELRMINKHPDQIKAQVEALSIIPNKIIKPIVTPTPVIRTPSIPIEVKIKQMADDRLRREQQEYDRRYGTGGIVILRRPN